MKKEKEVLAGEKCDILLENEVVKEVEIKNEDVKGKEY